MINDKKLLCSFIYSAYASGYCGFRLDREKKKRHMSLYLKYIKGNSYYPQKEINETQKEMLEFVKITSVRDYIYGKHPDIVKKRIEDEVGRKFKEIIRSSQLIKAIALNCVVRLYRIIDVQENSVSVEDIISGLEEKPLLRLSREEKINKNDIISGHWDYMLEKINPESKRIKDYKEELKKYYDLLKL